MKQTWVLDIECYPDLFYIGVKDYRAKEKFELEVSPYKDERKEIFQIFSKYDGYLVTFNGISYDTMLIKYILKDFEKLSKVTVKEFLRLMKSFSDTVIADDYEKLKLYKWTKISWTDIDLFCYWAKSLRKSKSISLKSLGIQLNHPKVQELPYHHTIVLTKEQIDEVKDYCLNNDIEITAKLFEKMQPDIGLRHYIKKEYGIECWSMDASKIASEYLLKKYCEKTWDSHSDFEQFVKETRKYRYHNKPFRIGDYLPKVEFKTKIFQDLFQEISNFIIVKPKFKDDPDGRMFNKTFPYIYNNTKVIVSMGVGGIHILNENEIYVKKESFSIRDQDVASLYPQLIENHRFLRKELEIVIEEYLALKTDRISAKREGNKIKDIFLKLVLNSFTGIADSDVTWVYSPEQLIALRLYGQLIQLRVMEELSEIGVQVISNNTDGTTAIIPDLLLDEYHNINNRIAEEFKITWEYALIDAIYYADVNNYLCVVSKKYMIDKNLKEFEVKEYIDIKRKGLFKFDKEIPLGDSVNTQIIPKALTLYFTENVPLEESIKNPDKYGFHIYDYCKSNKINKNYKVFYNGKQIQNLNRYYFSKGKPYLLKLKDGKKNYDHVNVGEGVILFNNFEEKNWEDYQINYQYYIAQTRKIVLLITSKQRQGVLFD